MPNVVFSEFFHFDSGVMFVYQCPKTKTQKVHHKMHSLKRKTPDFETLESGSIEKAFLPFTDSFRKKISVVLFCIRKKMNLELTFLCVEEIYQTITQSRLYSLVDGSNLSRAKKFLERMTNMGNIIAGGAIVYSLCEHVEKSAVGDIDIYVSTCDHIYKTLKVIEETFGDGNISRIHAYGVDTRGHLCNSTHYFFDIGLEYSNNNLKFQIILTSFTNWRDIVESFDLDYVRCAYFNSTFYLTEDCKRAHSTRTVSYKFCDVISQAVYNKIWNKGFSAPNITTGFKYEGARTSETIYSSTIYRQFLKNDRFSPLVKYQKMGKQKLKDEIISSYSPVGEFKTLCGKSTELFSLKLSRFKNLAATADRHVFNFDPIDIAGHMFSRLTVESVGVDFLKYPGKDLDDVVCLRAWHSPSGEILAVVGHSYLENLFLSDQ